MASAPRIARPEECEELGPLFDSVGWGPGSHQVDQLHAIRKLLRGEVFTVEQGGEYVGCAACVIFEGTGWIGSVAVSERQRRSGLGSALTETCVRWCQDRGARTVSLHATELGIPIYERLGFEMELDYATWVGAPVPRGTPLPPGVRRATPAELDPALALDRRCTGEGRGVLLRALWPDRPLVHAPDGTLRGYNARLPWTPKSGGILAGDFEAGLALIDAARNSSALEVQLQFPATNAALALALQERGMQETRRTARMRLGPPLPWSPEHVFNVFNLFWG